MKKLFMVSADSDGGMWIPDPSDIFGDIIEGYVRAESEDAVFTYLADFLIKESSEVDWDEDGVPEYKVDHQLKRIDWCEDEFEYAYIFEIEEVLDFEDDDFEDDSPIFDID